MNKLPPPAINTSIALRRSCGLDVVRCFAILFVIGGHFFLHTSFNDTTFSSVSMFFLGMVQTLMLINVPLFLMLTGYLNINKEVNRKYYRNGIRVIISYLVISIITILFRKYYLGEDLSWFMWVRKILDFSAIPYAWYIEMWIGLFLLTPFLNILWKNIGTRRYKHILLLTLYLLTALPDFFNRYGFTLAPAYWEFTYPVAFFFMGAYIREYNPVIPLKWLVAAIVGICLVNPTINIILFHHRPMLHLIGDSNGLFGMPLAALFFLLTYKLDFSNNCVRAMLAKISVLSLDMYLFSWIFDQIIYPFAAPYMPDMHSLSILIYYITVISTIFILSFCSAYIKELVSDGISRLKHIYA